MLAAGTAATLAVRAASGVVGGGGWLLVPGIWVGAAVAPRLWRGDALEDLQLSACPLPKALLAGLAMSVALAGLAFAGVAALARLGAAPPLRPEVPAGKWAAWSVHQMLYVAVSEEVFFRGYFQGAVGRLLRRFRGLGGGPWAAGVSAAAFAVAHMAVDRSAASATVFFPALAFAYLRMKTGGVAAPIVAHGASNILYAVVCLAF